PTDFLPVHLEGRFAYYFSPLTQKGLRPYVHGGAGLADVHGLVTKSNVESCFPNGACDDVNIKIYQRSGPAFVTLGGGAVYAFTRNMGLQANLAAMVMLPNTAFVLQPSLGVVAGF